MVYNLSSKIMLGVIIILIIGCLGLFIALLTDDSIWTNKLDTEENINRRQQNRGIITSLITSSFSVLATIIVVYLLKSDPYTHQALVNILCVGMIGFILDNAFATEKGTKVLLNGINGDKTDVDFKSISESLRYSFGSILSDKMPRYIIVTLLDVFISIMLTDTIVYYMINNLKIDTNLSEVFTLIVVGTVTFFAYANATRLEWAYPAVDQFHEKSSLIQTPVILISVVIASLLFMVWQPKASKPIGIKSQTGKFYIIMLTFLIIVISFYSNVLDPVLEYEIKKDVVCSSSEECTVDTWVFNNKTETIQESFDKGYYGIVLFFIISILASLMVVFTGQDKFSFKRFSGINIVYFFLILFSINIPSLIALF